MIAAFVNAAESDARAVRRAGGGRFPHALLIAAPTVVQCAQSLSSCSKCSPL